MNEQELIKKCLIDDDAIETYPFNKERCGKMPVIRHKSNNKWFALIFRLDGVLYIDHLSRLKRSRLLKKLEKYYEDKARETEQQK